MPLEEGMKVAEFGSGTFPHADAIRAIVSNRIVSEEPTAAGSDLNPIRAALHDEVVVHDSVPPVG